MHLSVTDNLPNEFRITTTFELKNITKANNHNINSIFCMCIKTYNYY